MRRLEVASAVALTVANPGPAPRAHRAPPAEGPVGRRRHDPGGDQQDEADRVGASGLPVVGDLARVMPLRRVCRRPVL